MKKSLEVGHAAYLLSVSALRALPAGFAQSLEQSRLLDERLKTIEANFAAKDASNVK